MNISQHAWMKTLQKKIKYVLAWTGSGVGQIFDKNTYAGCVRFIVFSLLVIYVGGHIDNVERWIDSQYFVSPGQEAWHTLVASAMGTIGIVGGLINIYNVYTKREEISSTDTARDQKK